MERERITISIKKNVLTFVDKIIDGVNVRNRSHAIEHLVLKGLSRSEDKNAVILIGGKDAVKHLASAEEVLKELKKAGYEKVYIATGYLANKIEAKLGDGSKYKLEIKYLTDGEGSGGALLPLKQVFKSTFLVFNTQGKITLNLDQAIDFHKKHGTIATIAPDHKNGGGIYILEPQIFEYLPKGFSMLEDVVFPKLAQKGEITGYLQF